MDGSELSNTLLSQKLSICSDVILLASSLINTHSWDAIVHTSILTVAECLHDDHHLVLLYCYHDL